MRAYALTTAQGGINRLRDKGSPDKDSLYDLLNGYVTQTNSIKPRPGTRLAYTLPEGTKGLAAFQDKLHVFSSDVVASTDPMVVVNVLRHPSGNPYPLLAIHFAAPFLGFLYVAAEFVNGDVYHYWLQSSSGWSANTFYRVGDIVTTTPPNGFFYRAQRAGDPGVAWAPNVARTVGDKVEPTVYNGYEYTVTATYGANPRSGATEPTWPAEAGATVEENTDGAAPATPTTGGTAGDTPSSTVIDRYGTGVNANRGGATGSLK